MPTAQRLIAARSIWDLSHRQAEVLELLVEGLANKEIANLLGCTIGNVEQLVSAVLRKSNCRNRATLLAHFWRG